MTDLRKAAEMALKFCEDIGSPTGPYPYVNETAIVGDSRKVLEALRQTLAQPEHEPIAYEVNADVINSHGQSEYRTFLAYRPDPAMTTGGIYEVTKVLEARPLYTAPPKREWVGLTEDEFEKILETHNQATTFAVYLSIEAKLKEKNT